MGLNGIKSVMQDKSGALYSTEPTVNSVLYTKG
jgi:hypothetical protein